METMTKQLNLVPATPVYPVGLDYMDLDIRGLIEAYMTADTQERIDVVGNILGSKDMWDNEHKNYREYAKRNW